MADDQKIRVLRPDGKFSTIPVSSLSVAVKRGYRPAPSLNPSLQVPKELQGQNDYFTRLEGYLDEAVKGTTGLPDTLAARSHEIFQKGKEKGGLAGGLQMAEAPFRAEGETLWDMIKGVGNVTTPALASRMANNEDPAKIMSDATTFLAGQMMGGKPAEGTLESAAKVVSKPVEKLGNATRILSQEISGAGKEPVVKAARARLAEIEKQTAKYQGATEQAAETHREAVGKHARDIAESEAKHAEQEVKAREKWVQKAHEHKTGEAQVAKVEARKQTLNRSTEEYTKILKKNIDSAHEAVRSALSSRWNALRDQVGKDTQLNSAKINDSIEMAKQRYLMGSPESLKVFNDLVKQMQFEEDQVAAESGGLAPALKPLTWEEGRVHYSALQDRIYSGELPGNVSRALRHVAETIDNQLSKVAESRGAGQVYSKLKSDWSQYMSDWKDMSSVATGGSPLARALVAKDPGFVSSQVLGKAGERLMQMAARYQEYGLSPRLMSRIRGMSAELKSLPKVKVPQEPAPYEAPAKPKAKDAPRMKDIEKPVEPPPINAELLRKQRLEEFAGRPFRFYDLFPPYMIEHMMMKNPKFREWVASQPRKELKP